MRTSGIHFGKRELATVLLAMHRESRRRRSLRTNNGTVRAARQSLVRWSRACVVSLSVLTGCGGGGPAAAPTAPTTRVSPPQELTTLSVVLPAASLRAGESASATVAAHDQLGAAMTVGDPAWTSSAPGVASVSASGAITALSVGTTVITARIFAVQGQATLTVVAPPPGAAAVASIAVTPPSATLEAGQSRQLGATAKDYAGNPLFDRDVSWTTSDAAVATVSPTGLVTALAAGTAILEATSESKHAAVALTVTAPIDTEITLTIASPVARTTVGDTMTVIATVQSLYPIVSVTASVGGQPATLTYGPIGGSGRANGWSAPMILSTLAYGPYAVIVTATDTRGHRGVAAVAVERNPKVAGGTKTPTSNK
jgi:hypothetical protein